MTKWLDELRLARLSLNKAVVSLGHTTGHSEVNRHLVGSAEHAIDQANARLNRVIEECQRQESAKP
jgi:hypothetical protein